MAFGANILNNAPSRWVLVNAIMDTSKITMSPSSTAETTVLPTELNLVPEEMYLRLVADNYSSAYTPTMQVDISIEYVDNTFYHALAPLASVEHNIFETILHPKAGAYRSFKVKITSAAAVIVTEWYMAAPVADSNSQLIDELRGELPKLLFDFNTRPFLVGEREETVALISAYLVADTDLSGHLQLTYTASEDATMTIRIKDNETEELLAPMLYSVKAGRFSVGIPHAYLKRKIGYHTFVVTIQVSNGILRFDTRSVMYTVDGAHVAYRLMDVGMKIFDLTLKRTALNAEVSELYAVGIDDGIASVRCRPYSAVANTAWAPKLVIGPAKEACVEFNGSWTRLGTAYEFVTDAEPWLFWITNDNKLIGRLFDNDATLIELAPNVKSISVIRGWKSTIGEYDKDQGLVVAYLDNNNVPKYRAYCMQADGSYIWEEERTLAFAGATLPLSTLRAYRTNDFRLGFTVTDATSKSYTKLTKRYWPGNMIPSEVIEATAEVSVSTIKVNYKDVAVTDYVNASLTNIIIDILYAGTVNKFIEVRNIDSAVIEFTTQFGFGSTYGLVLTDLVDGVTLSATSVTKVGPTTYRADFVSFGYFTGNAKLRSTGKNPVNVDYTPFEMTFTPVGLTPPATPPAQINVITNTAGGL